MEQNFNHYHLHLIKDKYHHKRIDQMLGNYLKNNKIFK